MRFLVNWVGNYDRFDQLIPKQIINTNIYSRTFPQCLLIQVFNDAVMMQSIGSSILLTRIQWMKNSIFGPQVCCLIISPYHSDGQFSHTLKLKQVPGIDQSCPLIQIFVMWS